jgi:hypothetical protein
MAATSTRPATSQSQSGCAARVSCAGGRHSRKPGAQTKSRSCRGPIFSLKQRADGGISLAGPDGFWVVGAESGAFLGERPVRLEDPGVRGWAFAPDGVVTALRNGLVRYPLRGEPTMIVLKPELEESLTPWLSIGTLTPVRLATSEDGGIVVGDVLSTRHEVKGPHAPDETCMARLRRFDAQGRLLWTHVAGDSKTWREWF